jgi:hypothetical protein
MSKSAMGPTQLSDQWVSTFLPGDQVAGAFTTDVNLVPGIRMNGAIPLTPYMYSCGGHDKLNYKAIYALNNVHLYLFFSL